MKDTIMFDEGSRLVVVDGSEALAYLIIRPGTDGARDGLLHITTEIGCQHITRAQFAWILRQNAAKLEEQVHAAALEEEAGCEHCVIRSHERLDALKKAQGPGMEEAGPEGIGTPSGPAT